MTPWWRRKAHSRHDWQERVASLLLPCCSCDPCKTEQRSPHSPGSSLAHCRWMASPAPDSSWIPHKSEGPAGEGGRKTEIHEYFLLPPEKRKESSVWTLLSMLIPKLEEKTWTVTSLLSGFLLFSGIHIYRTLKKNGMDMCSKNPACGKLPGLCRYQVRHHLQKRFQSKVPTCHWGGLLRIVREVAITGQSVWGPTWATGQMIHLWSPQPPSFVQYDSWMWRGPAASLTNGPAGSQGLKFPFISGTW